MFLISSIELKTFLLGGVPPSNVVCPAFLFLIIEVF